MLSNATTPMKLRITAAKPFDLSSTPSLDMAGLGELGFFRRKKKKKKNRARRPMPRRAVRRVPSGPRFGPAAVLRPRPQMVAAPQPSAPAPTPAPAPFAPPPEVVMDAPPAEVFAEEAIAFDEQPADFADAGEGEEVLEEEVLEGNGLGFFKKIKKAVRRNKNHLRMAGSLLPGYGGLVANFLADQGGARPAAAAAALPAPVRTVVRRVAAPKPAIPTNAILIGGAVLLAVVLLRK